MSNENIKKIPFLEVYPDYDLSKLPSWVRDDIKNAVITEGQINSVLMPDGRRYNLKNKLNHLSGQEWTWFINSVFLTKYPTSGKEGFAHNIRKIHPTPKPPQLMRDIISFFTKENELVMDMFMGVGGTLLGAALCGRKAIGIDLNSKYIEAYHLAAKELGLPDFVTLEGDCLEITSDKSKMENMLNGGEISLVLIDPPYSNMMSKEKTGGDIEKYGKNATPFTNSPFDLGNMSKNDYFKALKKSVINVLPYIKKEGHIVVFIKDLQPKGKDLNMLHYDLANALNEIDCICYKGMKIWADETSKLYPYGYPFSFVANQIHQYILIFRKEKD